MTPFRRILPLMLLSLMLATTASAEDEKDKLKGLRIPVKAGVNFNVGSNTNSDLRVTFGGGTGVEYYFHHVIGVFGGVDFMNRGYKVGGLSASTSYLDFPFGIVFQYKGGFGGEALNTLKLGGFFALPLDKTFSGSLVGVPQGQSYFGLTFEGMTLFPISDGFSMGLASWFKYGLASALTGGTDSKFLDFGVGLGVRFL